jgi:UDP-N-acetylmuramoylalanine--D-glutamate ligase
VDFVDDSKGTNVGATIAALRDGDAPLAVILGGEGKGQNFRPLAEALRTRGACAVGIGRDGPVILAEAARQGVVTLEAGEITQATSMAFDWVRARLAETGRSQGQVLLSPACASFDQFKNYAHRGEVFVGCVQALATEREGQP